MSNCCNPMDCGLPGSSDNGISQEKWNGLSFPSSGDLSNIETKPASPALADSSSLSHQGSPVSTLVVVVVQSLQSCPTLEPPWTVALEAPPSMGFPRQEYYSGLPFLSPGDPPDPGIEHTSPALQTDSLLLSHQVGPNKYLTCLYLQMSNLRWLVQYHRANWCLDQGYIQFKLQVHSLSTTQHWVVQNTKKKKKSFLLFMLLFSTQSFL